MIGWRAWLPIGMTLLSAAAHAATEVGTVTLVDGGARVLRGATWYKLATGVRVEEGDIVALAERAQVQIEFATGSLANLAGTGTVHLGPPDAKQPLLVLPSGWLKLAAKAPGVRVRTPALDLTAPDAIVVVHAQPAAVDLFVEAGTAKLIPPSAPGAGGVVRDAKRGEYWTKTAALPPAVLPSPPKAFVDAMPRHFADPLPALAAKLKAKPDLVVDHDITYAEALPWLAGRDRAAFERRFAVRLRDPAFRKAAEADIARYPLWDRQLHPEKYAPKTVPAR
jgi:hypothetical protein